MLIYLENEKKGKFWELRVYDAGWGALRTGDMGALGRSRSMWLHEEEDEAEKLAQQLAEKQKAKGFIEVTPPAPIAVQAPEPETLPSELLNDEQEALFTSALIARPDELQRKYWKRRFQQLLREKVYTKRSRLEYLGGPYVLAQEYETIASWDVPSMRKEVERDERGMVLEISYFINGLNVLTLRNRHLMHDVYPPIQPFFGRQTDVDGFLYGAKKSLVDEARQLLRHYPSFLLEHLPEVSVAVHKANKERKIASIARGGIEAMVQDLMKGTGYKYALKEGSKSSTLRVLVSQSHFVELNLPHGTFVQRMERILPTAELVKELLEALPRQAILGKKWFNFEWGEVQRHCYTFGKGSVRNAFWDERFSAYLEEKFGACSCAKPESLELDLGTVRLWKMPGMELEPIAHGKTLQGLCYLIDGRRMLMLASRGMRFYLEGFTNDRPSFYQTGTPPLSAWRDFLHGFPAFYARGQEEFNRHFTDEAMIARVQAIMADEPYQWALDLSDERRVNMHILIKRQSLRIGLRQQDVAEAEHILPTLRLVEEAMKASKIPFKLYRRDAFQIQWREET